MQNQDQPIQPTDKNKGDESAVEQQKKETLKKPSPENMAGAENAQGANEANRQVTGQQPHITNNDGAPVNASGKGSKDKDNDKNQANKTGM